MKILEKKRKLNILKYNKEIMNRLNIQKNDFEDFILLKEFNEKYNLNIKDLEIDELNLSCKKCGDEIFEDLNKCKLNKLKKINLYSNNIYDISNFKMEKLEILDLGHNKISNTDKFKNINLKELKELYFYDNEIESIKIFEHLRFDYLQVLNLSNNKISNIDALGKVNFKELKELYLSWNEIKNI